MTSDSNKWWNLPHKESQLTNSFKDTCLLVLKLKIQKIAENQKKENNMLKRKFQLLRSYNPSTITDDSSIKLVS